MTPEQEKEVALIQVKAMMYGYHSLTEEERKVLECLSSQ